MIDREFITAVVFSIPFVAAVVCFAITALDTPRVDHPARRRIHRQALWSYGIFSLCWLLIVARIAAPRLYVFVTPLFVPLVMAAYVLIYRMVRTATDEGDDRPLAREHFMVPALIFVVLGTVWMTEPMDLIVAAVDSSPNRNLAGFIIIGICFAYSMVYPAAALSRIARFRRRHRQRGCPHDRVLARLFRAIAIEMVVMPVPIFGMVLGLAPFTRWGWWVWIVAVLPSRVIYVISCLDMISGNYMVVETESPKPPVQPSAVPSHRLGRERVDAYFDTKKPWLNPAYRISDMAEDLYSNRAYVSSFINSEYGMNFSRFVNGFRLREVERLKIEARQKKQHVPMLQLVLNAGFSSYRSYLRAKEHIQNPDGDPSTDNAE
jgi:AraC-like DNA-binding protein